VVEMRWISNTFDPSKPDADRYVTRSFEETQAEAVRHYREWLADKIIGEPQPTPAYTVKQLKEMGMVGVYAKEESEAAA
jgi:hypothetical protein